MDENGAPTPDPNSLDLKETDQLPSADNTPIVTPDTSVNNTQQPPEPVRIFISYAHSDRELRERLEEHLSPLIHSGKVTIWHDQEISAGENWENQIDINLNQADIILLLVSASFIASKYCWNKEVQKGLERHKAGTARVIPIILKPARWQNTPLGQLQALPMEAKPVTQWNDQDAALDNVVQGIQRAVEHLRGEREPWIKTVISAMQVSAPYAKKTVLLLPCLLLIGLSLSIGLNLNFLDLPLPSWAISIAPFLCIPIILVELMIAYKIFLEPKTGNMSAKARERRDLLSALPLGVLGLGLLLKQTDTRLKEKDQQQEIDNLRQELRNSNQRIEELERWLDRGQLAQLRIGISGGDLTPSDTRPFENAIFSILNIPVSSTFGTYEETINALGRGDLEMAWLGPLGYLQARQMYNARALVCQKTLEGNKTYNTYIIANASANIHNLGDLKGKPLALSDPSSTSGKVIPFYELQNAGLNPDTDIQAAYVGSQNVIDLVLNNTYPAGATSSIAYNDALLRGKFHPGDLIIVTKSMDIPIGPFMVRNNIQHYDELRIEDAFFIVQESDLSIIHTMNIGGFAKVDDKIYDFLIPIANAVHVDLSKPL